MLIGGPIGYTKAIRFVTTENTENTEVTTLGSKALQRPELLFHAPSPPSVNSVRSVVRHSPYVREPSGPAYYTAS